MLRGAGPDEIATALRRVLPAGAAVRVGAEHDGVRNVGVDLPRCPRGKAPVVYTREASRALESAGVLLAPYQGGPPVEGQLRGSVRVGDAPVRQLALTHSTGRFLPADPPAKPEPKPDPLPEAIRDALGVLRMLWRASRGHPGRRYFLEQSGEALAAVLAQPEHPDGQRLAVAALEHLEAQRWDEGVAELLRAAADRVRGRSRTAREERERARALRS